MAAAATKAKRTAPLSPLAREALSRMIAEGSMASLARAWSVGEPTIDRAARGVGLTPAMAYYLTARIVGQTQARAA